MVLGIIPQSLSELDYGGGYVCSFPSLLGINTNGDVAPCDGLLSYKELILGNIREKSLNEIWNHPLMKKLRAIKPKEIKGVCRKCKYLSFCMGGCRARAFLEYGNFEAPNPLCQSFYCKNQVCFFGIFHVFLNGVYCFNFFKIIFNGSICDWVSGIGYKEIQYGS